MIKNNKANIMFLEKFIVTINFDCIQKIILKDLYENIDNIKKRGELPSILNNEATEREQLELQISKMIKLNELLPISKESCYITLLKNRAEEIFESMELSERHDYSNLATLYLKENIKKTQKQKTKRIYNF